MARVKRLESGFQDALVADIKKALPGCMTFKMEQRQGIPDLLVLHGDRWASLECKKSKDATHQPNQDYYVERMNEMSFSSFIYPENRQEVLDELFQALRPRRKARASRSK